MITSLWKYNQPETEIPTSIHKMGVQSVKLSLMSWLFIITFSFRYVHIIDSRLKKCAY